MKHHHLHHYCWFLPADELEEHEVDMWWPTLMTMATCGATWRGVRPPTPLPCECVGAQDTRKEPGGWQANDSLTS